MIAGVSVKGDAHLGVCPQLIESIKTEVRLKVFLIQQNIQTNHKENNPEQEI